MAADLAQDMGRMGKIIQLIRRTGGWGRTLWDVNGKSSTVRCLLALLLKRETEVTPMAIWPASEGTQLSWSAAGGKSHKSGFTLRTVVKHPMACPSLE